MSAAEENQAKTQQGTQYVVLRRVSQPAGVGGGDINRWDVIGTGVGINADAAKEDVVRKPDSNAEYVAVPMRFWNPKKPTVDTITRVRWS